MNAFVGLVIFVIAPIVFFLGVAWFAKRYQAPEIGESEPRNLFHLLKKYEEKYGLPWRLARYAMICAVILIVVLRVFEIKQ